MISIQIPSIQIEKVDNGWVVCYERLNPDKKCVNQYLKYCMVALDEQELLNVIKKAVASE